MRVRPHPYPPPAQALRSPLNHNTGIGNEAYVLSFPFPPSFFPSLPLHSSLTHASPTPSVYLLIPLKCSLTQLTLATNPGIDSTSVPAILLSKPCYLSTADTSINMNGLRTLAKRVDEDGWFVDIEVLWVCEVCIDYMSFSFFSSLATF